MAKQEKTSENSSNKNEPQYKNQIPDFKHTPDPPRESDSDSGSDSED